jgi:hypothetical protein
MTEHNDALEELNKHIPLHEKLIATHKSVSEYFPFIARIAIAVYDPETSVLKTYLHSSGEDSPLDHYQTLIDDAPSLKKMLESGLPRVINNMVTFEGGEHEHTVRIGRHGYAASYTVPIFNNGMFFGFIFFNSNKKDVSSPKCITPDRHLWSFNIFNGN